MMAFLVHHLAGNGNGWVTVPFDRLSAGSRAVVRHQQGRVRPGSSTCSWTSDTGCLDQGHKPDSATGPQISEIAAIGGEDSRE
jgi:hypothetical protein